MPTEAKSQELVELGRGVVDTYRAAHAQLHSESWYPQIHEDHTPLLRKLEADLTDQGFNSLDEFFTQSEALNIKELGFKDRTDFEARAAEFDRISLLEKWH